VLSWNVIYHGNRGDVGHRLGEIWRVLKPGAPFQGTMLTTRNSNYGVGRTVAPDTFVINGQEEKGHPHFYCDAAGLIALIIGFDLLSLTQQEHRKRESWHWHIIAERRDGQVFRPPGLSPRTRGMYLQW
jgi:tellurite methyltransferase